MNKRIKFLRFFVDDSFIITNKRHADSFFQHINNLGNKFKSIKFTIEYEINNKLPFLDVEITRINNHISTNVYRKPTHSNRYLEFSSHHSLQNKKAVIRSMANRAFSHSSDVTLLNNELDYITKILKELNYPINLINQVFNQCKIQFNRQTSQNSQNTSIFDINRVISIPYYRGLGENIRTILAKYDINVVFKRGNNIKNLLNAQKKSIMQKSNLVYNINCSDCDAIYIGTTKRKLENRVKEHKNALFRPSVHSNVADHSFVTKHQIDFENPKITYIEYNHSARKFLEGFDIEKNKFIGKPLMNDQQNMLNTVPPVYYSLIKK